MAVRAIAGTTNNKNVKNRCWLVRTLYVRRFAPVHSEPSRLRWASTRRDVIPAELCDAMGTLHENVPTTMHLARRLESVFEWNSYTLHTSSQTLRPVMPKVCSSGLVQNAISRKG